jgi:hypothetical protein
MQYHQRVSSRLPLSFSSPSSRIPTPYFPIVSPCLMPHIPSPPYTKCAGSKKFATPSITLYSCPQFPHTNLPSRTHVSSSTRCRSLAVWLGISSNSSSSASASVPSVAIAVAGVGAAEADPSIKSSLVGGVAGSSGRPSYSLISTHFSLFPCVPINPMP